MADLLSGPLTGTSSDPNAADPNAAPTDTNTLFGVSAGVFSQPLQTDAGFSRPPGMSGTNLMLNGSSNPRGEGPTYGTVGDALESFYSMNPQDLSQLQQELYQGGFYSSSYYTAKGKSPDYGVADEESYAAFKTAVIRAARSGTTLDSVLQGAGQGSDSGLAGPGGAGTGTGTGGGGVRVYPGGKVTVAQTDPQTIRDAANATAQKLLGRDLSDKEAQAVVDKVRADEDTKGRQQAAADEANRESTIQTNQVLAGQSSGGGPVGPSGSSPQGKLSPADRAKVAYAAGFRGQALVDAVAVSMAEGDVGEINNNPGTQDYSVGPWQINYYGKLGPERTAKYGDPQALANDPQANANAAFDLSGGGKDFSPWSTFKSGAYKKNLAAATAAAAPYLQGALASAGVPVQAVTPGGSQGTQTDIFLQPTVSDISTPITPQGAATQQIQTQNIPEMQEYGAQRQIVNFTQALHSMPGDTGAANAKPVAP